MTEQVIKVVTGGLLLIAGVNTGMLMFMLVGMFILLRSCW